MGSFNPYAPPSFPRNKEDLSTKRIESFHADVDSSLRQMTSPFTKDEFEIDVGVVNFEDIGYTTVEQILIFRGCRQDGNRFSYDMGSAPLAKAAIAASHLGEFTPSDFTKKYRQLFLSRRLHLATCGYDSIDLLLASLPGIKVIRRNEMYFLPREFHPAWKCNSQSEPPQTPPPQHSAVRAERYALFLKKAQALAKKMGQFTRLEFSTHWKQSGDGFVPNFKPSTFGFRNFKDLLTSIKGVRSVCRTGELVKYYFYEPDLAGEEQDDDSLIDNLQHGNIQIYDDQTENEMFDDVSNVAKVFPNPFSEDELHDALAKYYKVDKTALTRIGKRKVPLFLELVPGIKFIHQGKYQYIGVEEKEVAYETGEEDSSDSENEERNNGKVMKQEPRSFAYDDIIELGSSSEDEEETSENDKDKKDPVSSAKKAGHIQKGGAEECHDSEEEESSLRDGIYKNVKPKPVISVLKGRSTTVSDVKKRVDSTDLKKSENSSSDEDTCRYVKKEPVKAVGKRSRIHIPVVCVSIDEEPAPKNVKKEGDGSSRKIGTNRSEKVVNRVKAGGESGVHGSSRSSMKTKPPKASLEVAVSESMQEHQTQLLLPAEEGQLQQQGTAEGVHGQGSIVGIVPQPIASSNREFLNNTFSSQSSTSNATAAGNPTPMLQQGQIPPEHLLRMYMLVQQGIHGGPVSYTIPGQFPMPFSPPIPASSANSAASGEPYLNQSNPPDVKKEASSANEPLHPTTSGIGHQSMNNQPMNTGNQNVWGQQMPFGAHQLAPPMFHTGFPVGFGGFGLLGVGHPPQPQMFPQIALNFAHPPPLLPNNIMDFLGQYMGPGLAAALEQGANPLDLAKKVLENLYGNHQQPPPQ